MEQRNNRPKPRRFFFPSATGANNHLAFFKVRVKTHKEACFQDKNLLVMAVLWPSLGDSGKQLEVARQNGTALVNGWCKL